MKKSLISLWLATSVAITWCNNTWNSDVTQAETKENVIKLVNWECYYFENISWNTPKNAILYPIWVECTQKTEWTANISWTIKFSRSKSLSNTNSWEVISEEIDNWVEKIFDSLSKTNINDKVKKSYKNKAERKINVINWKLISKASPEWIIEGWDEWLLCINREKECDYNNKQNLEVAEKRAKKTIEKISNIKWVQESAEKLNNKIKTESYVKHLEDKEIWVLTRIGLKYFWKSVNNDNGNWVDIITKTIALYNTSPDVLEAYEIEELDKIIWDKRIAELSVDFTWEWINSNVDVSKWNYLYHLLLWTWLFWWLLMTKNGKKLREKINKIFKEQKKTSK